MSPLPGDNNITCKFQRDQKLATTTNFKLFALHRAAIKAILFINSNFPENLSGSTIHIVPTMNIEKFKRQLFEERCLD